MEFHTGIDIANSYGTRIVATAKGVVTQTGYTNGYGNMVMINHGNGFVSIYGHNSSVSVEVGQTVEKGQTIARMGSTGRSTGVHVHFEIRQNGTAINPYNILN
jgi:murein DD-endopeptidase MepM/ murein hydrolase activator NlpD